MEFRWQSTRREFFREAGLAAAAAAVWGSGLRLGGAAEAAAPDLAVTHGEDAKAIIKKAVELLGGMKRFVSKGDIVVVKPNIGWDRLPRQAANTSPEAVTAVIEMVFEAGAKEVKVFDNPVANAQASYQRSGVADAAKAAGAKVSFVDERFFKDMGIKGQALKTWPVYTEAVECDCLINLPAAKQHSTARLTMAMKNHMGIIGGDRGKWHTPLHEYLADFAGFMKPKVKLTILDAYRILVRNGPTGGSLADVQMAKKCVAGVDQVAVDAYGTTLFKTPTGQPLKPTDLGYLVKAKELGIGEIDLSKLKIQEVEA